MTPEPTVSPFATCLKALLDDTDFYTREQWACFFGGNTSMISDWVSDRALPRADLVCMALDLLNMRGNVPKLLEQFDSMAKRPATEVSPFGELMLPTVSEYLQKWNAIKDLGRCLRCLSLEQKQRVLSGTWDADAIESYLRSR